MMPIRYSMKHIDTDLHSSFLLTRKAVRVAIRPAPTVVVCNTIRVSHSLMRDEKRTPLVLVDAHPEYPRVILRDDWT